MVVKSNELNVGDVIADTARTGVVTSSTIFEVVYVKGSELHLKYLRGHNSYIMREGFCYFFGEHNWFLVEGAPLKPRKNKFKNFSL
jgi:hypothetical protein